jgi:predicted nucleic acid-binding protein
MKTLVVDASVAAKWFLPGPDASVALRLLDGRYRLTAPDLIYAEMGTIAWKLHARGVLNAQETSDMIEHFFLMPLEVHDGAFLLAAAVEIASATHRTVYDSLYLALAVELDGTVITADERWTNALAGGPLARYVRLLG